eukprot:1978595-Amphidinium_carterae.1
MQAQTAVNRGGRGARLAVCKKKKKKTSHYQSFTLMNQAFGSGHHRCQPGTKYHEDKNTCTAKLSSHVFSQIKNHEKVAEYITKCTYGSMFYLVERELLLEWFSKRLMPWKQLKTHCREDKVTNVCNPHSMSRL